MSSENTGRKGKSNAGRKPKQNISIAIDCGSITASDPQEQGGIATIASNMLLELARTDKRNTYYLYSFKSLQAYTEKFAIIHPINRVIWPQTGYRSIRLPFQLSSDNPDVFLGLSQAVPNTDVPSVGCIYDVGFIKFPQLYPHALKLKVQTDEAVKNSRHIITTSNATKKDLMEIYHLPADKISVIYPGVSNIFSPDGPKQVEQLPYFLSVGHLKKSRNIPLIITAFAEFLKQSDKKYLFILIGSTKDMDAEIKIKIKELNLEKYVVIKGYVSTADLASYYRGAVALVNVSHIEGFGFPVLEAMASGCGVIIANNSSLPEVVGKAGLVINSLSQNELKKSLEILAQQDKVRDSYAQKGLERAKSFSWHRFTKGVLDVLYEEAVGNN